MIHWFVGIINLVNMQNYSKFNSAPPLVCKCRSLRTSSPYVHMLIVDMPTLIPTYFKLVIHLNLRFLVNLNGALAFM